VNAGFGFSVSKLTDQTMVAIINVIMTEKMTRACRSRPSIRPYISTSANGKNHHGETIQEVRQSGGILEGVSGVHTVEPGPRWSRASLWIPRRPPARPRWSAAFTSPLSVVPCCRFEGRNLIRALEGHRATLCYKNESDDKGCRYEHVDQHAPHIHEVVAEKRIAAQSPNDCC